MNIEYLFIFIGGYILQQSISLLRQVEPIDLEIKSPEKIFTDPLQQAIYDGNVIDRGNGYSLHNRKNK